MNYKKSKNTILGSLLRVNLATFLVLFLSFIVLNLVFAFNLKNYEKVSNYIHDFADLNQYGLSLNLRYNSAIRLDEKEKIKRVEKLLNDLSLDVKKRISERHSDFLKIYDEDVIKQFNAYLKPLTRNMQSLTNSQETDLEDSYISILNFSNKHAKGMEETFLRSLIIATIILSIFIVLTVFLLIRKIKEVISPLDELTKISEKLSITDEQIDIEMNQNYYEYQVLASSFKSMYQRINYENRLESNASASSSVSHIVENIAHAINNPLATIATSIMLMKKKSASEDQFIKDEINICLDQIDRITEITHKMKSLILTTAKNEPTEFAFSNISTIINLLYFNRFLERNVKFSIDEAGEIFGKEEVITNILITLVENSLVHNDNEDLIIEVSVKDMEDRWLLVVHDNGKELPLMDIYQYFLGDKSSAGVGLFSARRLAEESGYNVYYNETPRKEFVLDVSKPTKTEGA